MYAAVLCPALIVGCTHDPIKPLRECAEAAAAMPKGRFAEAPSGHVIAVQSPELLLGLVKPFLENAHAA
jgi:pimeloyl-ACP methyl ester carboxylesterase